MLVGGKINGHTMLGSESANSDSSCGPKLAPNRLKRRRVISPLPGLVHVLLLNNLPQELMVAAVGSVDFNSGALFNGDNGVLTRILQLRIREPVPQ